MLPFVRQDITTSCVAALWLGLEHATLEKCTALPVTDPFLIVSGRGKDAAWLELYVQQDTTYTKTCKNGAFEPVSLEAQAQRKTHDTALADIGNHRLKKK